MVYKASRGIDKNIFLPMWSQGKNDWGLLFFFRLLSAFQIACMVGCVKERSQLLSVGLDLSASLAIEAEKAQPGAS